MSYFFAQNKSDFINPTNHPERIFTPYYKTQIFLAGPIQGAPDWQNEIGTKIVNEFESVLVTSPRAKDKPANYEDQVSWESFYLTSSDIIIFYIPDKIEDIKGRCYAQTTGFELGEWIAKANNNESKIVIISMSDNYPLKRYVKERVKSLEKDNIKVIDFGVDSVMNCLGDIIKERG